jgi:creatinine amidohydrolase
VSDARDRGATVEYERMSPREVVSARERAAIAYVPVAPLEWHGPHLPLGTDGLHAHHVAVLAARQTGGVVLPTTFIGTDSRHGAGDAEQDLHLFDLDEDEVVVGMDFPGFPVKSLYFHETVLGLVVRETVRLLKREPWSAIVLVNGHGAPNQARMLERIADEESEPGGARVVYATAWNPDELVDAGPGHADRFETSVMLALEERLVHVDRLPARDLPLVYKEHGIVDGPAFGGDPNEGFAVRDISDPRDATRQEGEALVAREVAQVARIARAALAS